jgi:hypothetical protein
MAADPAFEGLVRFLLFPTMGAWSALVLTHKKHAKTIP